MLAQFGRAGEGPGMQFQDGDLVRPRTQDGAGDVERALWATGPVAAEVEAVDPGVALGPAGEVEVGVGGVGDVEDTAVERRTDGRR